MEQGDLDFTQFKKLLLFCAILFSITGVLAYLYSMVVVPVLFSAFLTYLLKPLVDKLATWHIRHSVAIWGMVGGSVLVSSFATFKLVPIVVGEGRLILAQAPHALSVVSSHWLPYLEVLATELGIFDQQQAHELFALNNILSTLANQIQQHLGGIWQTSSSVVTGLFYLVLVPLLTFFFLKDIDQIKKLVKQAVPKDLIHPLSHLLWRLDHTLMNVLKGQVTVAAILGVLYVIGLSLVGLEFAFAIGVIAGIFRVIPYMDVVVGGGLSAIILLSKFTGWGDVIEVVLVFVVVQILDGALITPRIIGERIGLHPVVVILTVLALGDRFGFWGIILALPVAAAVKVLIEEFWPYYAKSRVYNVTTEP